MHITLRHRTTTLDGRATLLSAPAMTVKLGRYRQVELAHAVTRSHHATFQGTARSATPNERLPSIDADKPPMIEALRMRADEQAC